MNLIRKYRRFELLEDSSSEDDSSEVEERLDIVSIWIRPFRYEW